MTISSLLCVAAIIETNKQSIHTEKWKKENNPAYSSPKRWLHFINWSDIVVEVPGEAHALLTTRARGDLPSQQLAHVGLVQARAVFLCSFSAVLHVPRYSPQVHRVRHAGKLITPCSHRWIKSQQISHWGGSANPCAAGRYFIHNSIAKTPVKIAQTVGRCFCMYKFITCNNMYRA